MKFSLPLLALAATAFATPITPRQSSSMPNRALWLWDSDLIKNSASLMQFLRVASAPNHDFTTVHALSNRGMDNPTWQNFIKKCTAQGIAVEALIGDKLWIIGRSTEAGPSFQDQLDWIEQYQASAPAGARFSGIHLDVEPWGLDGWAANKGPYVDSLYSIVSEAKAFGKAHNLPVAADLPFWASQVPCKDSTMDICLLKNLDTVTFMTYRNTPSELLEVAKPAIETLKKVDPKKPVWLAVETSSSAPDVGLISYGGKSVETLLGDLSVVEANATKMYSNFAGIAVHSYEDFVSLSG